MPAKQANTETRRRISALQAPSIRGRPTFWQRLLSNRGAALGLLVAGCFALVSITALWVAPFDPKWSMPNEGLTDIGEPLPPGTDRFWLGTDHMGRDVLSRLIWGARVSLVVGLAANGMATVIAVVIGLLSGNAGGWLDNIFMRVTDVVMGFPVLLLAMALVTMLGSGLGVIISVIVVVNWVYLARIVRGQVLSIKESEYILASRSIGATEWRTMVRHILPQLVPTMVVYFTLGVATTVRFEATLSYLGVGVRPPTPSWGGMIYEGQRYYRSAPWLVMCPGLSIMALVLALNWLGDGMRDALDPYRE